MRSSFLGTSESRGTVFRLMYDQTGAAFFYVSVKIRDTFRDFHHHICDSASNQCLLFRNSPRLIRGT